MMSRVGTTGVAGAVGAAGAVGVAGMPGVTGVAGATAGAGGVAPAPFDVATIPGLVLWVDATRGVTASSNGEVTAWQDQSSARNDLEQALQYPAGYLPTGPGGHAVIRFATASLLATQDRDLGTPTLGFDTGDVLVEVVWAWSSQVLDQPVLFATMPGGIYPSGYNQQSLILLRPEGSGAVTLTGLGGDALTSSANLGDTQLHLVGAHRAVSNGVARVELRVDGRIDQVVHGDSPTNLPSAYAEMGGGTSIAEVVVVKGSITDGTLAALENYLTAKYGLR